MHIKKTIHSQSLYHNHQVQTCPDVTAEGERYPPIRGERFGAFRERQMVNCLETDLLPARPTQSHSPSWGGVDGWGERRCKVREEFCNGGS